MIQMVLFVGNFFDIDNLYDNPNFYLKENPYSGHFFLKKTTQTLVHSPIAGPEFAITLF
jgi:hypothetical protein